jgi:aromatic ring hydroxylase
MLPAEPAGVIRRGDALRAYARISRGMLGRPPDILNSQLAGIADSTDWFAQWGDGFAANMRGYYEKVRDEDLFLTHALGNPQSDRSKPSHQQRDPYLHVRMRKEVDAGLIVSGAKQLATAGPVADEILVWPNGRQFTQGDEPYCLAFAIPVSTPGVKCFCREPLVPAGRDAYDHPLSRRFEETDALIVFDDVLVPWERVFFYNNLEAANTMRFMSESLPIGHHPSAIRAALRAGLMTAVAFRIADTVETKGFPNVGEQLGRLVAMTRALEALVYQAEHEPYQTSHGSWIPGREPLSTYNVLFPGFYAQMQATIRRISGAGLMLTPTLADFTGEGAELAERYFSGAHIGGRDRVQVFKLAWDLVGESFAQRTLLYDEFHAGEPMFYAANLARSANTTRWSDLVDEILAEADAGR